MKLVIESMVAIAALAGTTAWAGGSKVPPDVAVYVTGEWEPPSPLNYGARATVAWMFDKIGIRLRWHDGDLPTCPTGSYVAVQVHFAGRAPPGFRPGALAYALPFGDGSTGIIVLEDRIRTAAGIRPNLEQAILTHVLAHEITHVLQSTDRHAETGLMKAHWDLHDYDAMARGPLELTSDDADLIRQGVKVLKARGSRCSGSASKFPEKVPPGTPLARQ